MSQFDVIVIGGGAAGMMAALSARENGASVCLLEANAKLGRKVYITGKGRCNLCNNCDEETFLRHVQSNARFMHSAIRRFGPAETMTFFEGLGLPLKTERGGRVFPVSDRAADVIDALFFSLRRRGIKIVQDRAKKVFQDKSSIWCVSCEVEELYGKSLIIATGGSSYPLTGSTGDG